jgi:hypothetical protein
MVDTNKQKPIGCRTFTATVTVTFPYEQARAQQKGVADES